MLSQKVHLELALTDYYNTLIDEENTLHFSPRYQSAYNLLSITYPIPNSQSTRKIISKKIEHALEMLKNYERMIEILQSEKVAINGMDCAHLIAHLTRQELTAFIKTRQQQISSALTNVHDFQVFIKNIKPHALALFFPSFPMKLTTLIGIDEAYFHSLILDDDVSFEYKSIILSALPLTKAVNLLTTLINNNRLDFFIFANRYQHTMRGAMNALAPELLAKTIHTAQDFGNIFKLYKNKNVEIFALTRHRIGDLISNAHEFNLVFLFLSTEQRNVIYNLLGEKRLYSMIGSITDFKDVFSALTEVQKENFLCNIIDKLAGFIHTIEDFYRVFNQLSFINQNKFLSQKDLKFSAFIRTPKDLNILFRMLDDTQLKSILPVIRNLFSILQTTDDFKNTFFLNFIFYDKLDFLFEFIIDMRNTAFEINFFSTRRTGPSELINLLAAIHLILIAYHGIHKNELASLTINIRENRNETVESILAKLKKIAGFNNTKRSGRLHNVMTALINAFENKREIDVAHLRDLASGSCGILSCC